MKRSTAIVIAALAACQAVCGLFGYLISTNTLHALEALRELLGGD